MLDGLGEWPAVGEWMVPGRDDALGELDELAAGESPLAAGVAVGRSVEEPQPGATIAPKTKRRPRDEPRRFRLPMKDASLP